MTVVEVPAARAAPAARRRARHGLGAHGRRRSTSRVLDNDEHPDGDAAHARARARRGRPHGGLLFASGDRLRYFAPDEAGRVRRRRTASRRPDGQFADARRCSISVREARRRDQQRRPCRATVTARVLAGETVRIPIPLGGIDPDGDSVQLLGQESNPETRRRRLARRRLARVPGGGVLGGHRHVPVRRGRRARRARDRLHPRRHRAAARRRAQPGRGRGRRHGAARAHDLGAGARRTTPTPTAARSTLTLGRGERPTARPPTVDRRHRRGRGRPTGEGDYGFIYTIENEPLGTASTFLTGRRRATTRRSPARGVRHRAHAERHPRRGHRRRRRAAQRVPRRRRRRRPRRRRSSPATTRARRCVADGSDPGRRSRTSAGSSRSRSATPRTRRSRRTRSSGCPAATTRCRSCDATRPRCSVRSGEEVVARPRGLRHRGVGRPGAHHGRRDACAPRTPTAPTSSSTTTPCGSAARPGTSARRRSRSRSPTASPPTIPTARTGTIVVPIDVRPTENQPPAFTGGVIDFEPGQSKTHRPRAAHELPVSRRRSTSSRYQRAAAGARRASRVSLDGQRAHRHGRGVDASRARARPSTIGGRGRRGRRPARSHRPARRAVDAPDRPARRRRRRRAARPHDHDRRARERRGRQPVPRRRRCASSACAGSTTEPARRACRSSRAPTARTLAVTVDRGAEPVNTTLQYQVADATDDPSRYAWGTVTISVQDRPDPVTGAAGHRVPRRHARRRVRRRAASTTRRSAATRSRSSTPSSGDGARRRRVRRDDLQRADARQRAGRTRCACASRRGTAIGLSDPVDAPGPMWSDVIPPPPPGSRALPLDGRLRIEWQPVPPGRQRRSSRTSSRSAGAERGVGGGRLHGHRCAPIESQELANGSQVPFSVSARNGATRRSRRGPRRAARARRSARRSPAASPSRRRRGRHGHGLVVAVRRQRRRDRRLLRASGSSRARPRCPPAPQACSVTRPAPGTVVAPSERRHRRRGRAGRVRMPRACSSPAPSPSRRGTRSSCGATTGPAARTPRSPGSSSGRRPAPSAACRATWRG